MPLDWTQNLGKPVSTREITHEARAAIIYSRDSLSVLKQVFLLLKI
jgi:hypothetical protein